MRLEARLQKLEGVAHYKKEKVIMAIQYKGESTEDAIRLAGYPEDVEYNTVMLM